MAKIKLLLVLGCLFFMITSCKQEDMIFYPDKLPAGYQFSFENEFEELFFKVEENTSLHGLLFRTDSSKGLVFYLHGNGGANDSWGQIADVYLQNKYDFFILDYRGYGKSQGKISGEKQLYTDIQLVYDSLKASYDENNIVIIGYSIGTGPATKLASDNNPGLLILKAPYYNLSDLLNTYYRIIPSFLIKYKFRTNEFIKEVKCPVVIFHGDRDEVIYKGSSDKLKKLFKPGDTLIVLEGQYHNGMNNNSVYREELRKVLHSLYGDLTVHPETDLDIERFTALTESLLTDIEGRQVKLTHRADTIGPDKGGKRSYYDELFSTAGSIIKRFSFEHVNNKLLRFWYVESTYPDMPSASKAFEELRRQANGADSDKDYLPGLTYTNDYVIRSYNKIYWLNSDCLFSFSNHKKLTELMLQSLHVNEIQDSISCKCGRVKCD